MVCLYLPTWKFKWSHTGWATVVTTWVPVDHAATVAGTDPVVGDIVVVAWGVGWVAARASSSRIYRLHTPSVPTMLEIDSGWTSTSMVIESWAPNVYCMIYHVSSAAKCWTTFPTKSYRTNVLIIQASIHDSGCTCLDRLGQQIDHESYINQI